MRGRALKLTWEDAMLFACCLVAVAWFIVGGH
jgi:hypothetical protein